MKRKSGGTCRIHVEGQELNLRLRWVISLRQARGQQQAYGGRQKKVALRHSFKASTSELSLVELKEKILKLSGGEGEFEAIALEVFRFQAEANDVYKQYLELLGVEAGDVKSVEDIPFLPVDALKHNRVVSGEFQAEAVFKSSGTTDSVRSEHHVKDVAWYDRVAERIFSDQIGSVSGCTVVGLLPGYLERGDSSLVHMVNSFMGKDSYEGGESRFFMNDFAGLEEFLSGVDGDVVLFGVTHAILGWLEGGATVSEELQARLTIIETGGMKGHGREPIRSEVHQRIKAVLPKAIIASEYGMTELISQAYSTDGKFFSAPAWMRVMLVDTSDPKAMVGEGKTGRIHIIDLANIDSCCFISTSDLGRSEVGSLRFEVLGRFDHSEVRGCNLLHTN